MLGSNPSAVRTTGRMQQGAGVTTCPLPSHLIRPGAHALNPGSGQSPVEAKPPGRRMPLVVPYNAQTHRDATEGPMPTRRGRPHEGPELADKLDDCSEEARQRLKVIFQTLAGV